MLGGLGSTNSVKDIPQFKTIPQLDGNLSILSDPETDSQVIGQPIPVLCGLPPTSGEYDKPPPWYEEHIPRVICMKQKQKNNNLTTIARSNMRVVEDSLPTISVYNVRSLGPKLNSFKTDIIEREIPCQ